MKLSPAGKDLAALSFLAVGTLAGWSAYAARNLVNDAEVKAGNHPYCIQVTHNGAQPSYSPLRSMMQLAWPSLRSPSGDVFPHYTFHAVLVVLDGEEKSFFNWSYHKNAFDLVRPDTQKRLVTSLEPSCIPTSRFLSRLPWLSV
ncbi:hypothetical protein V1282_003516 [Nitrobacteraceae bacterium AZCC 2146]